MFISYLKNLEAQDKAASTIKEYTIRLSQFKRYLQEYNLNHLKLNQADFLNYRSVLLEEDKSISRVNNILATIRNYYDFLVLEEKVSFNPVSLNLKMNNINKAKIERLSDDDLKLFKSYIDTIQPNLKAFFYLLIGTGARVSEIANLKKSDFELIQNVLYININDAKWHSDRRIPVVDDSAKKVVLDYLDTIDINSLPAFRVSKRTIQHYATQFSRSTGIVFYCHLLRHTFAAKLLEQGVPIQTISSYLGHKNIGMTLYYTQSANVDMMNIQANIL